MSSKQKELFVGLEATERLLVMMDDVDNNVDEGGDSDSEIEDECVHANALYDASPCVTDSENEASDSDEETVKRVRMELEEQPDNGTDGDVADVLGEESNEQPSTSRGNKSYKIRGTARHTLGEYTTLAGGGGRASPGPDRITGASNRVCGWVCGYGCPPPSPRLVEG